MNKTLTVSQLNNYIKNVFEDELLLQNITVEGEVFEAKFSGGNTYITLTDGDCVLSCVKFGARFEYSTGEKVRVTGSVRFYPRGGRTTFVVTYAVAAGKGDRLAKLNELKERLAKEGVFNNVKTLPPIIRRIALLTSVDGAVIHDFMEVLERNGCGYIDVDVYNVRVQGEGAERSIAKAFSVAGGRNYDVVVVARGGGSGQDLGCFNTEEVARAAFGCVYPVISAIGHEVDFTLCDFASSVRAGTPSIAAERIVRNNERFLSEFFVRLESLRTHAEAVCSAAFVRVGTLSSELRLGSQRSAAELRTRISDNINRMFSVCDRAVARCETRLRGDAAAVCASAEAELARKEQELRYVSAILDKTSPLKILSSGYAKVVRGEDPILNASQVALGDRLKVIMSGGTLKVTVIDKE